MLNERSNRNALIYSNFLRNSVKYTMRKAVIVLPTYNEAKNIENILSQIFDVARKIDNWDIHAAVVDSDSPDNTSQIVAKLMKTNKNLHIINTQKEGLGKAYIVGFKTVIEKLKPFIIFEMDADLSHDPKKIPEFLREIEKGADFVIGSRYMKGGSIPADWGIHRKFLSIVGNWIIRLGFMNFRITEWTNGYRAIKTWIIQKALPEIDNYTGYVFQVALLDNAIKTKANIHEIPIQFVDRKEGYSKINSVQYIAQALLYVMTESSFIKFALVGVCGFIIDFAISYFFIDIVHSRVWIGTLISTEIALISNFLLNNFWSFSHKKITRGNGNYVWSFIKFNIISSGSILIQTVGVSMAAHYFGREFWFVYKFFIITFIIIPYSYFFYNKFIWKDK